ncbi:uncharacterized protein LOC118403636 [Branchiostoma floridae]|uniref:Uncharacterized protein LOC118403636 n=1 Tax=Branchiostoma floridae TaxID=7739 RepID=A0A9J7HHE7_BRAFL|nr:uncharacterized protein LOC118403636 [Branchiostoma floridae]
MPISPPMLRRSLSADNIHDSRMVPPSSVSESKGELCMCASSVVHLPTIVGSQNTVVSTGHQSTVNIITDRDPNDSSKHDNGESETTVGPKILFLVALLVLNAVYCKDLIGYVMGVWRHKNLFMPVCILLLNVKVLSGWRILQKLIGL